MIRPLSPVATSRSFDVEIYDGISESSCPVSVLAHECVCTRVVIPGMFSPTSDPWAGSATRPTWSLWGLTRVAVTVSSMERPDRPCHPGFVVISYPKTIMPGDMSDIACKLQPAEVTKCSQSYSGSCSGAVPRECGDVLRRCAVGHRVLPELNDLPPAKILPIFG